MGIAIAVCYIVSCISLLVSVILYRLVNAECAGEATMNRLRVLIGTACAFTFTFGMIMTRTGIIF